ncbi:pitrilysin family protein [Herbivorax sp. ANBcel31]|uniref:EF-P 5-aminopentanol modification-associated protein YfmF n=1 Tax=Herbivorax sp. ANBcel31 TaxID=3069754 RepID=UPI0027B1C2A7|nr:pitrilysin family protein [Herbivorax sp. ANBcel31]MDQ2086890.1 pitrilysin family protein [Herbivorax sp. ANBcel31]
MNNSNFKGSQVEKLASSNGITLFWIKTQKFKTNSINIFFHDNLTYEDVSKNALVPAILRRGCSKYPSIRDISLYLEDLYGTSFDCGVTKKGENQIIQFYIEYISDKYADSDVDLTKEAFDFLMNIITDPVKEKGQFKNEYVDQEINKLKELIKGRVNDKMRYAMEKCLEEMCIDEPFGIYDYGSLENLKSINSENLFEHYVKFIETLPMYVFISGDLKPDQLDYIKESLFKIKRGEQKNIKEAEIEIPVNKEKNVIETFDVNQGKLSLGFRTNTYSNREDYYKLILYNSILGGGVHSKLFQNVREKEGLAYYAFSRLEKFKGLMVISSGIEIKNKEKAIEIIKNQLEDIEKGNITEYEYQAALKSIETGIKSFKDSQLQLVDFYLSQFITRSDDSPDAIIEKVKNVSKEDVAYIASKIKLDTVYFITNKN